MDVLIRYGFTIEEIKSMMDSNNQIESTEDKSIYELIDLLGSVGCLSNHIKNTPHDDSFPLTKYLS